MDTSSPRTTRAAFLLLLVISAVSGQTPPGQAPSAQAPSQSDPSSPSSPAPSGGDSGSYSAHPSPATAASTAPPSPSPPPVAPVQPTRQQQPTASLTQQAQQQVPSSNPPPTQPPAPRPVPAVAPSPSSAPAPASPTPSPSGQPSATPAKDKEEEDVSYVVGILAKPKKHKAGAAPSRDRKRVRMTSKSGVEFSCELPGPADPSDEEQAQLDAVTPETVVEVLKQRLSKGPCFERTVGYWAYKVCPFREVTQFHRESNGALSSVFHLGHYEPQSDKAPSSLTPYSQSFTKGTGERNSEVRYVCPTDKDKEKSSKSKVAYDTTVASVSEPWALHYEIEVQTQHACLTVKEKDAHKAASSSQSVLSLLTPLKGKCFNHVAGWWTYEFCYLDRVRQYHAELVSPEGTKEGTQGQSAPPAGTKHVVTAEYVLGRMEKGVASDWLEKNTAINRRTTVEDSFVGQLYQDGTNCDLTSKPREITVQFFCDAKEATTRVSGVAETATCQYTMSVYTSLLCDHPYFKPKQPKVKTIVCEPVRNVFTGEAM